ncbi:MAG TPA: sterol desaturase family protein [Vitreimonas sp.]|nr:sterol desaturase family protein [Vitreimonas sp.]
MPASLASVLDSISATLQRGALDTLQLALIFALIALVALGPRLFAAKAKAATGEVSTNITLNIIDLLVVTPLLGLALGAMGAWMQAHGAVLVAPSFWASVPAPLVGFLAIFFGDFIGYWRHRLEHTAPLWPAHAIHHSDTAMTWTTIFRFHPINRFSTGLIDTGVLALFGFPPEALFLNNVVRHYWGSFIHMDVPWSFGFLSRVICTPVMHRWHHIREANGAGVNFATVFSVFDQVFGTYSVPGLCTGPLGVRDEIGPSAAAQLWHPFKVFFRWSTGAGRLERAAPAAHAGRSPALRPTSTRE